VALPRLCWPDHIRLERFKLATISRNTMGSRSFSRTGYCSGRRQPRPDAAPAEQIDLLLFDDFAMAPLKTVSAATSWKSVMTAFNVAL